MRLGGGHVSIIADWRRPGAGNGRAAERELVDLLTSLLTEVGSSGGLRGDVAPKELAQFCLHALGAAGSLPSQAAVRRLVAVTMSGLRPPT